ncbi:MAG TPA: P1 family peptidase [Ilumatobacteraceae bacterium]|nr:P1 family peptidase [Ilumatobacteraceae bacterium]
MKASSGSITDVPGVRVGHAQRVGRGWLTGTTVVSIPRGAVPGVDVRGGGPGTRETDALDPRNLVDLVHAVCLTGGSAFGLAAADGVMDVLAKRGLGVRVGPGANDVVPVVPAAVIFDLGRGGDFDKRPDAGFGRRALIAARPSPPARGAVGAGTGAVAGGLQGGVGTASARLTFGESDTIVVGALAVVNASGAVLDPRTGLPWEADGFGLRRPSTAERASLREVANFPEPLNTTIGVIATSARLTKAEVSKLASVGHDGIARAVRPSHSLFDGDTVFALATCDQVIDAGIPTAAGREGWPTERGVRYRGPDSRSSRLNRILDAAARCFAAACTDAIVSASAIGDRPAFRDVCPSAFRKP